MSTPVTPLAGASHRLPQLVDGLLDDAAVFPPGDAPLPVAVTRHQSHRQAWYAAAVGPLLVPAHAVADLIDLLGSIDPIDPIDPIDHSDPAGPVTGCLEIGVIARPGVTWACAVEAATLVKAHPRLRLAGLAAAWSPQLPDLTTAPAVVSLELPRGVEQATALVDVRRRLHRGEPVVAKFRTGATSAWPWPDEGELARVLGEFVRAQIPFRLTGGLHHAARTRTAGEEHHGFLNVILAVAEAQDGGTDAELAAILRRSNAAALAGAVARLPQRRVGLIREALRSYGCCEVRDPLRELVRLGLLDEPLDRTEADA